MGSSQGLREEFAATATTRRTVVKTGAKLGYAIPIVAATYKLSEGNALAACGGDTPYPFEIGGYSLCCGCCSQVQDSGADGILDDAFAACQKLLADNGKICPRPGEPGWEVERVCIAENAVSPVR